MNLKKKMIGAAAACFLAFSTMAGDATPGTANDLPLVVSYQTKTCGSPPCPQIRHASRAPDFRGTFKLQLYKRVNVCSKLPCPPFVRFRVVSAGGFSRLAKTVVLHGKRREHERPRYYARRLDNGFFLGGPVTIEGDCWFDEASDRLEILVRSGISKKRERDVFKYGTPVDP
jgi:hypothetical protein